MPTRVLYSAWQLQCCGDAFSVGDTVEWTAVPVAGSRPEFGADGANVEWAEEHHPSKRTRMSPVSGVVSSIRRVRDGVADDVASADGTGPALIGYVVTLD